MEKKVFFISYIKEVFFINGYNVTNLKNNPDYRKTPTLDATITLTDDGLKRTNFITDSGSKTHVIIQDVYTLGTNIEKCFSAANVNLYQIYKNMFLFYKNFGSALRFTFALMALYYW